MWDVRERRGEGRAGGVRHLDAAQVDVACLCDAFGARYRQHRTPGQRQGVHVQVVVRRARAQRVEGEDQAAPRRAPDLE